MDSKGRHLLPGAFSVCIATWFLSGVYGAADAPEAPRVYLDTTWVAPTGSTIYVPAGGNLQAALNSAQPGDEIVLQAGATFTGQFTLPKKTGDGWITIRSSADPSRLPGEGERIHPSYSTDMARLQASGATVLRAAAGAHNYRLVGIEIAPSPGTSTWNLIEMGDSGTSERPHDIIFDRTYIHGDPIAGTTRGIAMNGSRIAVIDSYLSDFKAVGYDSQAIGGWNGPGPFKIVNNYLEGAGENVMFGGATPGITNLVPSDIEVRNNTFYKPLAWRIGDERYKGTAWTIKNLFELKNAQRVLIEGNTFEQSWVHAQSGYAILFTVRGENGNAPWATIQDVIFQKNLVEHAGNGFNILGYESTGCVPMARVLIKDNVFDDIGPEWGSVGKWFVIVNQTGGSVDSLVVDHNTAFQESNIISAGGTPNTDFVFTNNITPHNLYGIHGDGVGVGIPAANTYFPGWTIEKNAVIGGSEFPLDYDVASVSALMFVDYDGGVYLLADASPYRNAGTDGKDVGADWSALQTAIAIPRSEMYIVRTFAAGAHSMELRGQDFGRTFDGFRENQALDEVLLGASANLTLIDLLNDANRGGIGGASETLYVGLLDMAAGSTLNLGGKHVYVHLVDRLEGTVLNGSLMSLTEGDANDDFKVDSLDLAIWQQNYDPVGTGGHGWTTGDWNGDGRVDSTDLAIWQRNYAPVGIGAQSLFTGFVAQDIPEPVTLTLLGLGFSSVILRGGPRRRKRVR